MSTYDINLFTKQDKSITDKLLFFALHYFRYIVVLTQIVVISVFFYRLTIDQKIIDQKEAFRSKQQILSLTVPLLEEARATEESTNKVGSLIEKQSNFSTRYDSVIKTVPQGMVIIDIEFTRNTIKVTGVSDNTIAVQQYYRAFQRNELYGEVEIKELNLNANFQFAFTIELVNAPDVTPEPAEGSEPQE